MDRLRCAIGWIVAIGLCGAYSVLLGAMVWVHTGSRDLLNGLTVMVPVTFCFLLMLCFLGSVLCRKKRWDSKGHGRIILLVILISALFILTRDAPPIPNDFNEKDVICQDPNILASYPVYMTFQRGNELKKDRYWCLPRSGDLLTELADPLPIANQIEEYWQEIAPLREVIRKLDAYPGIADLTPEVPLDFRVPVVSFLTWRKAAQAYALYASLKEAQRKPEEGARELSQLHRVIRKALPYNGILVNKMINLMIADLDIQAAHRLLKSPHSTQETLKILKESFAPLTAEEVSSRRVLVGEYVGAKNLLRKENCGHRFLEIFGGTDINGFQKLLSDAFYQLAVQKNRTLRLNRQATDLTLREIEERPWKVSSAADDFIAETVSRRPIRNVGGWVFFCMTTPSFLRAIERSKIAQVHSDLLALEIHQRLGEKLELTDPFTGKAYVRDEKTGEYYSPHDGSQATGRVEDKNGVRLRN